MASASTRLLFCFGFGYLCGWGHRSACTIACQRQHPGFELLRRRLGDDGRRREELRRRRHDVEDEGRGRDRDGLRWRRRPIGDREQRRRATWRSIDMQCTMPVTAPSVEAVEASSVEASSVEASSVEASSMEASSVEAPSAEAS